MSNIEDKLWEHLVEHHGADRAQLRSARTSPTRRRRVMVGMAAGLAAVGVASVLATSSGSGSLAASGPSAGPVKIQDSAYIVKRVRAKLADSQDGTVIRAFNYARGDVSSDGSLVNLGWKINDGYDYVAPDGTVYTRSAWYNEDGSLYLTGSNVQAPDSSGDGKGTDIRTLIDPATQTYSQTQFSGAFDPESGQPTPNLYSSASEVQRALQSGQVSRKGSATVNGTHAIALSIKLPRVSGAVTGDLTLYVDAQTYQPMRTVEVLDGLPDLLVASWMPATPDNIAQAEDDSIPAGYTKVEKVSP